MATILGLYMSYNLVLGLILAVIGVLYALDTKKWKEAVAAWLVFMGLLNILFWLCYAFVKLLQMLLSF